MTLGDPRARGPAELQAPGMRAGWCLGASVPKAPSCRLPGPSGRLRVLLVLLAVAWGTLQLKPGCVCTPRCAGVAGTCVGWSGGAGGGLQRRGGKTPVTGAGGIGASAAGGGGSSSRAEGLARVLGGLSGLGQLWSAESGDCSLGMGKFKAFVVSWRY